MASSDNPTEHFKVCRQKSFILIVFLTAATVFLVLVNIAFLNIVLMRTESCVMTKPKIQFHKYHVRESKDTHFGRGRIKRAAKASFDALVHRVAMLEQRLENSSKSRTVCSSPWLMAALRGRDGRDGRDGAKGSKGEPGPTGFIPEEKGKSDPPNTNCKSGAPRAPRVTNVTGRVNISSGVVYTRWGRTVCPIGAQLLYKGRVGGNHHSHTGSGSNHICLPEQPLYANYNDKWQYSASAVYGVEYEVSGFNPFKKPLNYHDVPCAVCYVSTRGSYVMIPSRNICPSGWTREYWGYLMSEKHSSKGNRDFVCVDEDAENVPFSHANYDGAKLAPVQAGCSVLSSSPYVCGRELTCAVCSK